MLSCEFCETFKKTYFEENLRTNFSELRNDLSYFLEFFQMLLG